MGSVFRGPTAQAFHDQVHRAGRLLLLLGDLHAHWSAAEAGGTVVQTTPLTDVQASILRACQVAPPPRVTTLHPA
jgi:hypothetical protein